ncbi:phosphopentomutase [Drosophila kikkawai]|uniref:Phosphopentomutase n=1 Tax=Drosophila kikkawai TaxID=30033 RepID=A0A6P4IVH4_DROKI|nr:phosphoglucomutase-2 [Drosophila kikkawai]XP_017027379.1 phosphoglucomutase-2 [Drosophila kikkawai]
MCTPAGQLMREIKNMTLSGDKELDDQIRKWVRWDKCPSTSCQIMDAVRAKDWDTLRKRLCNRITFGTAGLRATMRAGFDSMNELVVIQTAQGLCEYIKEQYPNREDWTERGVVFGYDGRYNSHRFAELSAIVFLNNDFKVWLYKRYVPTPMVPYAIVRLQCLAGVMVTASHNPKEDNGYKVYWSNGAQIIPPHDEGIQEAIMNNLEPSASSTDDSVMCANSMLEDPYDIVVPPYFDALKKSLNCTMFESNNKCGLSFTYTAMHGVGYEFVKMAFAKVNLKPFNSVCEQQEPDPEFPTTPTPNPEEGKTSLDLAIKTAKAKCSQIILANDPDADRLAVAEVGDDGNYKLFTGNEVGALLGWWALELYKIRNPGGDLSNVVMIGSTVSSKILRSMAEEEGFQYIETLTGFKWMGNKAIEQQAAGKTVLFAFEEAIGYMFGTAVPDKDGVSAAAHLATMACYLRCQLCMTLQEKLRDIYESYGFSTTIASYVICRCPPLIEQIFERLRTWDEGKADTYPTSIMDGEYEIENVCDLTTGYDSSTSDKKATLPTSSSSQMITFTFKNGAVITLRTSGTEPKMKYYAEMRAKPEVKNWTKLSNTLNTMVEAAVEEFYEPKKNGLQRKKD